MWLVVALALMAAVIAGAGWFIVALLVREEPPEQSPAAIATQTPTPTPRPQGEAGSIPSLASGDDATRRPPSPADGVDAGAKSDPVALPAPVGKPLIVPAGRSPIPQPGEEFREPIPFQRLTPPEPATTPSASAAAAESPKGVIPWDQAHRHVGRVVTVEGRIVRAHNTGKVCFLNFVPDHPSDAFYLIVFEDLLSAWPQPPDTYFMNKTVRATGQVHLHRGKPQIRIERKDQIEVVP